MWEQPRTRHPVARYPLRMHKASSLGLGCMDNRQIMYLVSSLHRNYTKTRNPKGPEQRGGQGLIRQRILLLRGVHRPLLGLLRPDARIGIRAVLLRPRDRIASPSSDIDTCSTRSTSEIVASWKWMNYAPNQMTMLAAVQRAKRKGNPFQLSPVLSMMAWMTLGPIMDDARFDSPNKPKNCETQPRISTSADQLHEHTHHVVEARRRELGHHSLRERVVRRLE